MEGNTPLRVWLAERGAKVYLNYNGGAVNRCNWIASLELPEDVFRCELNSTKRMVLFIYPYEFKYETGDVLMGGKLQIRGCLGGQSYKIEAYSLSNQDLFENFDKLKGKLVKLWQTLGE